MKYIKYTGVFKDLIPLGFEFQKLYAANYRCYHDYHKPGSKQPIFWIWQKGREIEIEDWHHLSAYVVEYLRAHPFTPRVHPKLGVLDYVVLIANMETCEIKEKTLEGSPMWLFIQMEKGKISKDEYKKRNDEYHKTFREIIVVPKNLFEKLELLQGKYEVVEEAE